MGRDYTMSRPVARIFFGWRCRFEWKWTFCDKIFQLASLTSICTPKIVHGDAKNLKSGRGPFQPFSYIISPWFSQLMHYCLCSLGYSYYHWDMYTKNYDFQTDTFCKKRTFCKFGGCDAPPDYGPVYERHEVAHIDAWLLLNRFSL